VPIPETTREQLLDAMRRFDSEGRNTADWSEWESKLSHKFAISHEGRRYPVKEIIRLATGATDFSGGSEANGYVQRHGLTVEPIRAVWIFQANPEYYDLSGAIEQLSELTWLTPYYEKEIHKGDTVYLWESGPNAGVLAVATILTDPEITSQDESEAPFAHSSDKFAGEHLRVRLHVDHVLASRILRRDLLEHPILANLGVIRMAQASIYKVIPQEAEALTLLTDANDGPSYWWVNQGGSYERERTGGYLWAPTRSLDGGQRAHHVNVARLSPGDVVLNYANGALRAISRAVGPTANGVRPESIRDNEEQREGYVAPLAYGTLTPPIRLYDVPVEWRVAERGPFDKNGDVNQGYLFPLSRDFSQKLLAQFPILVEQTPSLDGAGRIRPARVVKVAPGEHARLWNECLLGEFICVGWDEIGDLNQYPNKSDFDAAFAEKHTQEYNDHAAQVTRKANELWMFRELRPGDRVVANRGISEVLAIGRVIGTYEWHPERSEYQHLVPVKWDTSIAKEVPEQRTWATTTVAEVPPELLQTIVAKMPTDPAKLSFTEVLRGLDDRGLHLPIELVSNYLLALQAKRLVILSGVSGTGKTQLALAIAQLFRPTSSVAVQAPPPDGSIELRVLPYMLKYRRLMVPSALRPNLKLPPLTAEKNSGPVEVVYPDGSTTLSLYRDPDRPVLGLIFSGKFRSWFETTLSLGDSFFLGADASDESVESSLRLTLPSQAPMPPSLGNRTEHPANFEVIAVRPDWTDNRGLLGYFNPLTGRYVTTPLLRLLLRARDEYELADRENREPLPYFAVLDEMNLARVEHYFSDFLSALESGEPVHLHDDLATEAGEGDDLVAVPRSLTVPPNVFFTGTVNVDESTYMFSPKVLDRAFTIELNEVDLDSYGSELAAVNDTAPLSLNRFAGTLTWRGQPNRDDWMSFTGFLGGNLSRTIIDLHTLLAAEQRHFGYRVANEIARFVSLAAEQTEGGIGTIWAALDLAIIEKVLPKFHGTQQELEAPLRDLFAYCVAGSRNQMAAVPEPEDDGWSQSLGLLDWREVVDETSAIHPRFPRTAAKLRRMLRRLRQQGFTSFIE
jgi:5-methylcytosine-specific restriction enzyme B